MKEVIKFPKKIMLSNSCIKTQKLVKLFTYSVIILAYMHKFQHDFTGFCKISMKITEIDLNVLEKCE